MMITVVLRVMDLLGLKSGIDEANATFANTGVPGNNAVIAVAALLLVQLNLF